MKFVFDLIIVICMIAVFLVVTTVISFFADVPKQLKRIADALEKMIGGAGNEV